MKIISWNARGFNSLAKQRLLHRKFQKEKPDIMFIQESKRATSHMENISKKLGKPIDFIEVASQRWEGGITTLWDTRVVSVLSMEATRSYIATEIQVIGETLQNHKDISSLLTRHFKHIAQETQDERTEAIASLPQAIPSIITNEQNLALLREVSMEEVEEAVKSMPNDKAPGPDGFTINFYKACWPTIKIEIWEVVEDSRRSGTIPKSLNSTFLALIPKEEDATTPKKFRPIALCNVIYKIISKVIANRLKPILPNLISEEKSGYVEGRQILDNILLAQEMVHTL
eukprot:PITA_20055